MKKVLHCYAEGQRGSWEAVCLDFDLAVQGDNFEEVYRDLKKSIQMYCEYVEGLPVEERPVFINRKASLSLRFRFLWYAIRIFFGSDGDGYKTRHEYTVPCVA